MTGIRDRERVNKSTTAINVNPRIKQRLEKVKTQKKRTRLRKLIALIVAVSFLALSLWVLFGPLTKVNVIYISNVGPYSKQYIINTAGLENHPNLVTINPSNIDQKLKSLSFVDNCSVSFMIPDGLKIDITYRQPIAYWKYNSSYYEIDPTGRVLARTLLKPPLIEVSGINTSVVSGQFLSAKYRYLISVVNAVIKDHINYVSGVDLGANGDVNLKLSPVGTALLGQSGDLEQKLVALNTLYNQIKLVSGEVIDLSVPQSPVTYIN